MIMLTFCLRRAAHLSPAAFRQYWLETHGPLVRRLQAAIGATRYAQLHALADDPVGAALARVRGAPEAFDGIAQMCWASRADLDASMTSPAGRAAGRELLEDERRFIDLAQSPIWLNEVHEYELPRADPS